MLGLEILLPVAAVVVVHIIQVATLVQVQRVKVTMVEMERVILLALVVEAALVPSVETALALPLQVSAVLVVLVVLHRLLARP